MTRWAWLRPWPLLAGAVAAIVAGVAIAPGRGALSVALVVLGAVCLGAWIALLAAGGHHGES